MAFISELVLHRTSLLDGVCPSSLLYSANDEPANNNSLRNTALFKNKTIGINIPVRLWWMQRRAVMYSLIN